MIALRMQQDIASDEHTYQEVCQKHVALASSEPENVNYQYLAVRCLDDEAQRNKAFVNGAIHNPQNSWFNFAAGFTYAEISDWAKAEQTMDLAISNNAALRQSISTELLRFKRLLGTDDSATLRQLALGSDDVESALNYEQGESLQESPYRLYSLLNQGDLEGAITALKEMGEEAVYNLPLIAASHSAPKSYTEDALKIDVDQLSESSIGICWALAAKAGRDTSAYEQRAKDFFLNPEQNLVMLQKVQSQRDYPGLDE